MRRIRSNVLYAEKHVSIYTTPAEELGSNGPDWGAGFDQGQGQREGREFGAISAPVQVWGGSLKAVQEELDDGDDETEVGTTDGNEDERDGSKLVKPFHALKLKLVFFNKIEEEFVPWAEVWYNPLDKPGENFSIAKNGEETIQLALENCQNFKIIAQLPGSGYHPIEQHPVSTAVESNITQIALELRFSKEEQGMSFLGALDRYHANYSSVLETYLYEEQLAKTADLRLDSGIEDDELDDDGFGDFVEA